MAIISGFVSGNKSVKQVGKKAEYHVRVDTFQMRSVRGAFSVKCISVCIVSKQLI